VKAFALAILCASLVLTGCTVRFVPSPDIEAKERLNLYVGLLIPKAEARQTAHIGSKTILTGNALEVGARNTFQQLFTNVYELQTREQASATPDLQLLLLPRVVSFDIDSNGNATVVLGCRLTNVNDRVLMDSTWTGSSSPVEPAGQAGGGHEAGKIDMAKSGSEAFEAAFKQMAEAVVPALHRTSYRN
jgi:hypothetical protein